nr:hypothetical protein [Allomuricauda sp.]
MRGLAIICGLIFLFPFVLWSQEEESAEVFLDEYTDEFQDSFFEALKQKGIQNYDRAVTHLLKCKELDGDNNVVDYELARTYFLDKKYPQAEQYGIAALNADPSNYWYLENLVSILDKQGNSIESLQGNIPVLEGQIKENLANVYFHKRKYKEALETLDGLTGDSSVENLRRKIKDSMQAVNKGAGKKSTEKETKEKTKDDPVADYRNRIDKLILNSDYEGLEKVAKEALDEYPLQPYFYYAYGKALTQSSREKEGIEVLIDGLDYLLDDNSLRNKIYQELAKAYASLGDEKRANEYLGKIEPGS